MEIYLYIIRTVVLRNRYLTCGVHSSIFFSVVVWKINEQIINTGHNLLKWFHDPPVCWNSEYKHHSSKGLWFHKLVLLCWASPVGKPLWTGLVMTPALLPFQPSQRQTGWLTAGRFSMKRVWAHRGSLGLTYSDPCRENPLQVNLSLLWAHATSPCRRLPGDLLLLAFPPHSNGLECFRPDITKLISSPSSDLSLNTPSQGGLRQPPTL